MDSFSIYHHSFHLIFKIFPIRSFLVMLLCDRPSTERCLHYLKNSFMWKNSSLKKARKLQKLSYIKETKNGPWTQMRDLWKFGRWTVIKGDEIVSRLYDFVWCESRWRGKTKNLNSYVASDNLWGCCLFFERNYLSAISMRKTKKRGIKIIEIKMWRH